MGKLANYLVLTAVLGILAIGCNTGPDPMMSSESDFSGGILSAAISIPPGATFQSATFYIHVSDAGGAQVNVHRITSSWDEGTVTWNNFMGSYAPGIIGSFTADAENVWRSVDVTALVQGWLNGTYDNHGLLLDQGQTQFTEYWSSEFGMVDIRPKLEVCYVTSTGMDCEIIQRGTLGTVADAYISEQFPDDNNGSTGTLLTGLIGEYVKQSLVNFELEVIPQEGCTRTIGYWKNHAGFGPQDDEVTPLMSIWLGDSGGLKSILIGDAATAVDVLKMKTYGKPSNGITKLYAQLLGAKLNVASGASGSDVAGTIADADAFLAGTDWNDWSGLSDADKDMVEDWKDMLDDYNKGDIGPGHCDD
jgi:hypothetical protein